jgi:hypothetical protein
MFGAKRPRHRATESSARDPKETSWKQGARQPLVCGRLAAPSRRSLDDEGRFEGHGPGHVVEVG